MIVRSIVEKILSIRWILQIIGLKAVYQLLYLFFVLFLMKSLSVQDYGTMSYILAIVLYFSTLPLIGLPFYIQKSIAKQNSVNLHYFLFPALAVLLSEVVAFSILPQELTLGLKLAVLMIISYNFLTAVVVAINDGRQKYLIQYQFLLSASLWMIIIMIRPYLSHEPVTIANIIRYWAFNTLCIFVVAVIHVIYIAKHKINIDKKRTLAYSEIGTDLLFMFSVIIPDGFAKFYDRFLANTFLPKTFLGEYSFNLMIVATVYAFFIRPINSIFLSQLARKANDVVETIQLIKTYYFYTLLLYATIFCTYTLASNHLLPFLGLEQYQGTLYLFHIATLNMVFYSFAYPFITLLNIQAAYRVKLLFCLMSLSLFNIPALFLTIEASSRAFLTGFMCAYSLNLVLVLALQGEYAKVFFATLCKEIQFFIKVQYNRFDNIRRANRE